MKANMNEEQLSNTLKALSDESRRAVIQLLAKEGPMRVSDLSAQFDMSLNGISKHIKVLEKAKLVSRKVVGRTHWIEAHQDTLDELKVWLDSLRSIWSDRLDALETIISDNK